MFIKDAKVTLKNKAEVERFNKLFVESANQPRDNKKFIARKERIENDERKIIRFS